MEHRREQVLKLYSDGNSYQQIAKLLNMSKSTVAYYIKESENLENINKEKKEKPKKELRKSTKCPDKETLINDFKMKGSFKQVGQIYGVSDNTVKKWFKKYELPISSPEMRKSIIEQFGKQPQWYEFRKQRDYTKSIEKNGVKVDVYDSTGEFLNEFNSILQTSKFTGVSKTSIERALKGKNIKDKRYIFMLHQTK